MTLAAAVAWAMFAVLIGWLGMVLYATFRTLDGELREANRGDRTRTENENENER